MSGEVRVLLAEDHALVRAGIRSLLSESDGVEGVAEASDGRKALALMAKHEVDVALLDISMPEMNGLEAATRIARDFPNTRVIIVSMYASEEYVHQALVSGATGYILKDAGPEELEIAVRAVARGESYLSPAVSRQLVSGYVQAAGGKPRGAEELSVRQRQVLKLLAEGYSNKEIARKLNVGLRTVETHREQLMEKLDIHEITGLVRYAIRVGLISPER